MKKRFMKRRKNLNRKLPRLITASPKMSEIVMGKVVKVHQIQTQMIVISMRMNIIHTENKKELKKRGMRKYQQVQLRITKQKSGLFYHQKN